MKNKIISVAFGVLLIAFSSCEKSNTECNLVPVKVLRYDCDRVIVQLFTEEFIGDNTWKDMQTGQQYNNVASYYNTCKIMEILKAEKGVFYVSFKELDINPDTGDCAQCLAVSQNPPKRKIDFSGIYRTSCGSSAKFL